jgi:hypothetical protein
MRLGHLLKITIMATLLTAGTTSFVGTTALVMSAQFSPAEAYPSKVRRACKTDYKRLCPRYKVGSSKMRSCMRSNVGQISPRCYDTLVRYGYGKRGGRR